MYEWESNNTMSLADSSYLGKWCAGNISSTSDVDYWSFSTSSSRTTNFIMTLPSSSVDYDITIYNSSGSVVASSAKGTGETEIFSAYLPAGKYYAKVYSYSGSSSSSNYQFIAY